jgi:hypothetical protein
LRIQVTKEIYQIQRCNECGKKIQNKMIVVSPEQSTNWKEWRLDEECFKKMFRS